MGLVSVIVPCYNASSFIDNLSSVFEQSYKELELVLVDDCSGDDTWQKLQEFKRSYAEQKIIIHHNEQNLGPGLSRNEGFALSSGEFIVYWDIDDKIEPNFIEKMLSRIEQEQADFACCGYYMHQDGQVSIHNIARELLDAKDILAIKTQMFNFMWAPWNKLVRRSFIEQNNISYPDEVYGEDRRWTLQLVVNAQRIAFVDEPLYHYVKNSNSISSLSNKRVLDGIFNLLQFEEQYFLQKGMHADVFEMWRLFCLYYAAGWFFRFPNDSDLQNQFAAQFFDFCQQHNIELVWQKYPVYAKKPLYRLVPKLFARKLHERLKREYLCCKWLRKHDDVFSVILAIGQNKATS